LAGDSARTVEADGTERVVPLAQLVPGMRVSVLPGEKLPADGVVARGASDIDSSLLTGEAAPETVAVGAKVFAGTLNLTGPLLVQVDAAADDTLLADIVRLMEAAERGRSAYIKLVDRIARLYSPSVHVLALITLAAWMMLGAEVRDAMMNAVAVLIITCPCALGLAVPVVRVAAHGLLFSRGVLVKASDALERIAQVDTVVFDKTGTLTKGEPELVDRPIDKVLAEAAALAQASRHPLSRAVLRAAGALPLPTLSDVREVAGSGVEGVIAGRVVRLGRRDWAAPQEAAPDQHDGAELWLAARNGIRHRLRFRDAVRDDCAATVAALKDLGLAVRIVSGDRAPSVAAVAQALGVTDWQADCRPDDKVRAIKALAEAGARVLMVGDGLNDAPALAAGFVSASPAAAADISRTAADVIFQGERLAPVLWLVRVARAAHGRVRENIALSIVYNTLAVPLAMAGLVTPLIAAVAMSTSSILVSVNALRVMRMRL
jgi:Cu2+-exporting ATPase